MLAAASLAPAAAAEPTLVIEAAWTRATRTGAAVTAGYLRIVNRGTEPDRLLGASSSIASRVELHENWPTGGADATRAMADGIEIPAGGATEFAPGGYHLVFLGLSRPLWLGASFPVTLRFARAGDVQVVFDVQNLGTRTPAPMVPQPALR
jgi:hypothetical protein